MAAKVSVNRQRYSAGPSVFRAARERNKNWTPVTSSRRLLVVLTHRPETESRRTPGCPGDYVEGPPELNHRQRFRPESVTVVS
jgi:hypothetical protein